MDIEITKYATHLSRFPPFGRPCRKTLLARWKAGGNQLFKAAPTSCCSTRTSSSALCTQVGAAGRFPPAMRLTTA